MVNEIEVAKPAAVPTPREGVAIVGGGSVFETGSAFLVETVFGDSWRPPELLPLPGDRASKAVNDVARVIRERAMRVPSSPEGWVQTGFAELAAGRLDSAHEAFVSALRLEPNHRNARMGLARVAHEQRDPKTASEILERLIAENATDIEARVSLAVVLVSQQRLQEARELLVTDSEPDAGRDQASLRAARGGIAFLSGDYRGAVSELRKAIRGRPEWVHARTTLALAEWRSGRLDEAERQFKEAVRVGPLYTEALAHLLRLLLSRKRWNDVLLYADKYWRPGFGPVAIAKCAAEASMEMGNARIAKAWLEPLVDLIVDPFERGIVLNNLGVAHSRLGAWESAERFFKQSVESRPSPLAVRNRGKALIELGKPAEAASFLFGWIDRQGYWDAPFCNVLGSALLAVNQPEAMARLAEDLVSEGRGDLGTYAMLVAALVDELNRIDDAIKIAAEGSGRWPESPLLINNWAYALAMGGRLDEAAQVLSRVSVDDPASEPHKVYLIATRGLILMRQGDVTQGRELYERALTLARGDALRARVKAKRDLETARQLIRGGASDQMVRRLLQRAQEQGEGARPYSEHAQRELRALKGSVDDAPSL